MARTGRFVASIEARMGSTRLPGKALMEIMGVPMLELLIERLKGAKNLDDIVIATSINIKDDALEALAKRIGVKCFRGSEEDVLKRVLEAAHFAKADHIVEIWGDTPLLDPKIIDHAIEFYHTHEYDCIGTLEKAYPLGMSLLIFPTKVLAEVDLITQDPIDRENVSNYIYEHPKHFEVCDLPCPENLRRPDVRLTVDEAPDLELVRKLFEALRPKNPFFDTKDILDYLNRHPQLLDINKAVKQKVLRV